MSLQNRIIQNGISIVLLTALILSGLFSYPETSYAEKIVLSDKIYYHFDLGVQLAYNEGSEWGRNTYGTDEISGSWTLSFGQNIKVENVYPLDGSGYDINSGSENIPNDLGDASDAYQAYYADYATTNYSVKSFSGSGNKVTFSYKVKLDTNKKSDVVAHGEDRRDGEIYQLFGGKSNLEHDQPVIADAVEKALAAGLNGTANGNKLYLVFVPTVIEYKKYITVGDLEAQLSMPDTAKQGEDFTLSDDSILDDSLTLNYTTIEWVLNDGGKKLIATWEGTGEPGENSGGSITQSFDETGRYECILTAVTTNGQVDTDIKYINIVDKRDISINADLTLPEYTYEGHTVLAQDQSTFEVDGAVYSATRAYAEDIASNSFKCASSTVSIDKLTDTKANATFAKTGTYSVNLKIKTVTGGTAADTESIEVRKTPYILDNLSGFQKQNRKQILTATVATYPGKLLTDYSITLKDKVTGELIRLTQDNLQENSSTIKTRSVTVTQDTEKGFAYITVEFLTKTPNYFSTGSNIQDFYYQINVEDSKGDTDTASKTFTVTPDLPPIAAISLDTAFLRNEGTNTASITAEDVTVAVDGDRVERTWYYAPVTASSTFTNIETMNGYKKLSFGTDKIVGFNKVGVGKFTTKLSVKEVWTEPTLEEYVTDSDHLTGSTLAYSDVQNVAPIVSLELLNSIEQEILLLANSDSEYQTLMNHKTALQKALLENCIDGQIIIKKLIGNTPSTVTGIAEQRRITYPYLTKLSGSTLATEVDESKLLAVDSENTYFLTYTWVNGNATVPETIHAINTYSGEKWSYTTSRNEVFTYGQDDTGKYLYLIYAGSNQTALLDKRTGAVAGTINIALSDKVWLSDNLAFIVRNGNLYAIDLNSLAKTLVSSDVSAVSRVGGDLQFLTKSDSGIVRNILDMETLNIEKSLLIDTKNGEASPDNYKAICIDSSGKAVLWKSTGSGTDLFNGFRTYTADNKLAKQVAMGEKYSESKENIFYALDENGECRHVVYWELAGQYSPDRHYIYGVDLSTGTVAYEYEKGSVYTNAYNSFGGAFTSNGVAYFLFNGWYLYPGGVDYYGQNWCFSFFGTSGGMAVKGPDSIGPLEENIRVSDRSIAAFNGDNDPTHGNFALKILAYPRTLAQETTEVISRFTNKLTFVGGVNTTADEIKAAAEAPRPKIKITATKNGFLSISNQPLEQNKKYYYEYDIKPLTDSTESSLNGLIATHNTTVSTQTFLNDTYYVEKTYEEDFNDSNINRFFTLAGGSLAEGMYGAYRSNHVSNGKVSITVPTGKKAILSFDYRINMAIAQWRTSIYIDGERMYEDLPTGTDYADFDGHYTHYKLLSAGTHTIDCKVNVVRDDIWEKILLDDLKVDILSTTKPTLNASYTTQKDNGWINTEGSFETPSSTISYGSQASSCWSGALGVTSVVTGRNGYRTYNLSVPAGYYVRGWAYPTGTLYKEYEYTVKLGTNSYTLYSSSVWPDQLDPGEKTFLGTLQAGDYTQSIKWTNKYLDGYIPQFDLISYPVNTTTATGDITFNDSFTEYYFPKQSSTGLTNLSLYLPKGEYLLKNLKMYYIENGQKIYLQNEDCEELTDLSKWTLSTGLTVSIVTPTEEKTDDEYVKIYKKGEKVLYNIFYSDYENDPSKTGYWVYTHINWPPDKVHPDAGKVLTAPIDRFYLSGKYTVTHWEVDNTQRTGTVGDAGSYNKESNKVTMTFYVDGEGNAPWITYIKTNPAGVKENNSYTIQVGVDDSEKDTLTLETEVYLNGKSILTDSKTGIAADAKGDYPEQTIAGLPTAKAGVYQVICTVSDYSGTGIKSYKFTVVSEGKITGYVNHTDQWDNNRKKYNLKRFSEEVNRPIPIHDYLEMSTPRKRGTNVFWSGEKFMLRSETEGNPDRVKVLIQRIDEKENRSSTGYSAELSNTGKKTASGAEIWEGSLWEEGMINKWGRKNPEQLAFDFTAYYSGGLTKTNEVIAIVDSRQDYWQLHRLW